MKEIAISKFKATCLAVLERVRKTGEPILVTRFGHPWRKSLPVGARQKNSPGGGAGTAVILGDIVGPIGTYRSGKRRKIQRQSMQRRPATRNETAAGHAHLDLELLEPHK